MRHPSPNNLTAFVRGELPEAELLEIGNHVAGCEECAGTTRGVVSLPSHREWSEWHPDPLAADHLDDEQLLALVKGQCSAADRRHLEDHLAGCRRCREDLADLNSFHARVAPSAGRIFAPVEPSRTSLGLVELFRRVLAMRWLPASAAAGLAGLAVFYLGVQPLRTQLHQERNRAQELVAQVQRAEDVQRKLEQRLAAAPNTTSDPQVVQLGRQLAEARARETELNRRLVALQKSARTAPAPNSSSTQVADAATEQALKSGSLQIAAAVRSLQGETGRLLGSNDDTGTFSPARPLGTVVRSQRPVFRWSPLPGATGYRVMVFDEAFNEVGRGEVQGQVEWQPQSPLARGKAYHWEIVGLRNGEELERTPRPPAPPARFRVLDATGATKLADLRLVTPLQRGVHYASFGLLDDAQRELQTAAEEAATSAERKPIDRMLKQLQAIRAQR